MRFVTGILFLLSLMVPAVVHSQEIQARVSLNKSQIQNPSLDYLDDLVTLIENYINNLSWTEHTYEEHERIRMNLQIALIAESNNVFEANSFFYK